MKTNISKVQYNINLNWDYGAIFMKLYDLKTLSMEKNISITSLRRFLKKGMPHYRPDRKIYVNPTEFDEWFIATFQANHIETAKSIDTLINNTLDAL